MNAPAKKVLIVEDEKPMSHALDLKFTHAGVTALTAFNGEAALEILEHEKPDIIMTDLMMPKMDGFQFLEKLKERGNKVPVVVLSNLSQEEDRSRVFALGAKDFLIKSDTPIADIVETIKKMMGA